MRQLLIVLLVGMINIKGKAQGLPLYICDTTKPSISAVTGDRQPLDIDLNVIQSIYYKTDFPTMPVQGFISEIFFRIATYPTPAGSKIFGLRVKMGTINTNEYPASWGIPQIRTFDSTLTTVFYDSLYVLPTSLAAGSWWKLTLPQPYQYSMMPLPGDVPQNLVMQLSKDTVNQTAFTYKFHLYGISYQGTSGNRRSVRAFKNQFSPGLTGLVFGKFAQLIGFNGYALSVDDPQKKIPFSVFPNPAKDKLHVSKEASGSYEVYDLRGAKVLYGSLKEGEEVNVQHLSPGMYMLKLGERTTRFVKN